MKQFRYTAFDAQGAPTRGVIEAADWQAAVELLAGRGLTECREIEQSDLPVLSASDAVELAGYLAELSKSGLPLGGTLRALAQDASSEPLRRVIDELTSRLESGQTLELALESLGGSLPEHIRRMLVTAARSGQLSQSLDRLLAHEQQIDDMGRRLRQVVAYPMLLLALLFGWLLFVTIDVLPRIRDVLTEPRHAEGYGYSIFDESGFPLGLVIDWLPWILCGSLGAGLLVVGLIALVGGKAGLSRALSWVPLVGPCWRDRGLTDFAGLMTEFVDAQMTLPEALELTSGGVRDPAIGKATRGVKASVNQGAGFAAALHYERGFPATMTQWSAWGQQQGTLPAAMRASAQMFAERFELRLQFLRTMFPAIVFALIAASAMMVVAGVYRALYQFLSAFDVIPVSPAGRDQDLTPWVIAAVVAGVILVGFALLMAARLIRGSGDVSEVAATVARFVGIFFVAAGTLIASVAFSVLGFLAWLVLMVGWIRGAWRYRQLQRQSLWTTLSLAAESHTPLAPMALAFADEQRGSVALAARQLARQLAAGADLSEALDWTSAALPPEAPLAVRVGTDTGDLVGALRAARGERGLGRPLMPASVVWMLMFLPISLYVIISMVIYVLPSLIFIFDDFSTDLPPITVFFVNLGNWNGLASILLPILAIGLTLLPVLVWLQWRGTLRPWLPGLKRVTRWIELAPLLRIFSLVTRTGQPLSATLESMARLHPHGWIRRQMRTALGDIERGFSWQASLKHRGLISDGELAMLAAAERNGNLPWALSELGDSLQRRAEFRLRVFGEFAFPFLLMIVGLLVAFIVFSFFLPLVQLIISLS